MTEKRFTVTNISANGMKGLFKLGNDTLSVYDVTRLINELLEENEQLKKEIQSINKDLTQIMLILLDDDIVSKLTEIELKAFERLSKFKGDV